VPALAHRRLLPFLRGAGITNLIYMSEGQVLSGGRNIRFDDSWLPRGPSNKVMAQKPRDVYPDIIFFSSGTTGLPKKYVHTYQAFLERLKTTVLREIDETSRTLVVPTVSSSFGFNRACELFYMGKTACFSLPGEMRLALITSYCIDSILASAQQALGLVNLIEKGSSHFQLDSLKSIRIGGGLMSKGLARRIQASLCRRIGYRYSSTEAGVMALANYDTIAHIPNAVGYVLPWVQIEVVDETGAALPRGTEGYIRSRTPRFLKNFCANNPNASIRAQDAWWYSGDLGSVSEDGVLCISGRTGDVINRGGHKVSAAVLEEVLLSCAGIKDGGVCDVMNGSGINEIWIGVVPETTIDIVRLKQTLESDEKFNTRLDEILLVDSIPRSELGKIQRHELRAKLTAAKKKRKSALCNDQTEISD
jgi:acyl-coenzyme A synthetase/AMP-(fatty) acid ligase